MVTLYIATHNTTGLKYFGKTELYFTEQELQKYYHGSGVYWKNHIKKHGDDISMKVYGIYKNELVEKIALEFSKNNDIVNSKDWANLMYENGLDGSAKGRKASDDTRRKMSECQFGKTVSDETKMKISLANIGKEVSQETRNKIGASNKNSKRTEDEKIAIGNFHRGKVLSDETKAKMSESRIGMKYKEYEKVICPHCSKEGKGGAMKRYHFDNCKFRDI